MSNIKFHHRESIIVGKNEKFGYQDRKGQWMIKPEFDGLEKYFDNEGNL
jgi:hypothetical protein